MRRTLLVLCLGALGAGPGCYHVRKWFTARTAESVAPRLYAERCSTCHGPAGRGDGPAGQSLSPRPRDFADARWQRATSDADIRNAIHGGGGARGLSPLMPAQPDLGPRELDELVAYLRQVGTRSAGGSL
jgi:mono/diheme cytochrome c family protein